MSQCFRLSARLKRIAGLINFSLVRLCKSNNLPLAQILFSDKSCTLISAFLSLTLVLLFVEVSTSIKEMFCALVNCFSWVNLRTQIYTRSPRLLRSVWANAHITRAVVVRRWFFRQEESCLSVVDWSRDPSALFSQSRLRVIVSSAVCLILVRLSPCSHVRRFAVFFVKNVLSIDEGLCSELR